MLDDLRTLRSAFDDAPVGMALCSPDGVVLRANEACGSLLGRRPEELVDGTFFDVTHPDDVADARDACQRLATSGDRVVRHETRFVHRDGRVLHVVVSTAAVVDDDGAPRHLVMHLEDVSESATLVQALRRQALHDPLTGLPNRVLLLDRVGHALARGQRRRSPTCLLFLDLDGFKAVNDTLGHHVGDQVLVAVARRLEGLLRPQDTAARLGGDEFVVLCEDTRADQAQQVAERLRAAVLAPLPVDGTVLRLGVAVGLSCTPGEETDVASPEHLLRAADRAMYEAKQGARR